MGGYIPSNLGVDSMVVGFYRRNDLIYAARVRAGLVPATQQTVPNIPTNCSEHSTCAELVLSYGQTIRPGAIIWR
jgi:hypothetical protein